ncbi:MAG: ABC transporter substrate-binding protein [Candidatus Korarchaeum sp.]
MTRTQLILAILVLIIIIGAAAYFLTLPPAATPTPTSPTTTPTTTPTEMTTPPTTTVPAKKTLRVFLTAPIQMDPAVILDWASYQSVQNTYDTLVRLGLAGDIDPKLGLAERWDVSSDGLTYKFYLRKGVKFHSGRELTSKDVVFSMERLLKIGQGPAAIFAPIVDSIKAIDDYTVEIKMKQVYGPFLYALSTFYVLDSEEVKQHIKPTGEYGEMGDYGKEWLLTHDAGSGPYKIKEHLVGERLVLERFKDYWGYVNPNAPDEVTILPAPETATQVSMLLRKEIDITYTLPAETIKEMMGREGVGVSNQLFGQQFVFVLNTKRPPLDDVHIRRALAYALDYEQARKAFLEEFSQPAIGPVARYIPGAPKDVTYYTRNLALAREELRKSKYYNELDKYPIELWWCAEAAFEEKPSVVFATSVMELDPKLKIEVVKKPWASIYDATFKVESTPHITVLLSTPWFPEVGSYLELKFHSKYAGKSLIHVSWLLNSTIDKMIDDALSTVDQSARFSKYKNILEVINSMVPEIVAFDYGMAVLYRKDYIISWPAGEGKPPYAVQYMYDFRFMELKG